MTGDASAPAGSGASSRRCARAGRGRLSPGIHGMPSASRTAPARSCSRTGTVSGPVSLSVRARSVRSSRSHASARATGMSRVQGSPSTGTLAPPSRCGDSGGLAHPVRGLSRGVGSRLGSSRRMRMAIERISGAGTRSRLDAHTCMPPDGPDRQMTGSRPASRSRPAQRAASASARWREDSSPSCASRSKHASQ